jgi:glycosyltransferase involved in cell wall biosynthesis
MRRDRMDLTIAAIKDEVGTGTPICSAAAQLGLPSLLIESPGRINCAAIRRLRRIIKEREIAIVHSHGYKGDLMGRLATLGTRCRIVTTPHGWTHGPDLKLRLYEILDRSIFPFMDAVVPLSEDMHRELSRRTFSRSRLQLILNAVDLEEIENHAGQTSELAAWKSRGLFIIGYIGRLIQDKGIATLLRAVAQMSSPEVGIALIGTGPDESAFRETARNLGIAERVRFLGYREDRLSFLNAFDLFVLPSLSEGIPRCIMEAMGLGIPVAASDIPGCRVLVRDGETGCLFPPGDEKALARTLEILRINPDLRKALAQSAKARVYEQFSAKRMAREYELLFENLAIPPHADEHVRIHDFQDIKPSSTE